ncbi:MAG: TonB family protein [Weeksellaceae bacterium]
MKNNILKSVLAISLLVAFILPTQAQEQIDCNSTQPLTQKMCYQKLVTNLGEFIEYPDEAYFNDNEGIVLVRFSTDENSQIKNVSIVEAPNRVLAKEVLKAVQLMALESRNNYMAANQKYRIPIQFSIK